VIPDLNQNDLTKDMEVTKAFGGGSLIGAPIILKDGRKFGTLCGMDNVPFQFEEKHIHLFKSLASLLTYVINVDDSYQQILKLSTPMVPIFEGVAILPIIGSIDEERGNYIVSSTIKHCYNLNLEHLIIDVSGITDMEEAETFYLLNLVHTLKLIGIEAIFTGIRPDIAKKAISNNYDLKNIPFSPSLNHALSLLGINLIR
jgi:rsbT co-antagonist protein RsbR